MERIDKKIIGIIVFISVIVFANTAVIALHGSNPEEERIPAKSVRVVESSTSSLPYQISIPSIGVEARVQHVGIGKSGNMAVPHGYEDVGWYRYGAIPGQRGSAVMGGHVNNGFGLGGVFKNLKNVEIGDRILYTAQEGTRLTFVVEDVRTYDIENAPTELIFNRSDTARLNLITCDGEWSEETDTYNKRLVVFAKLEK
jgi:LPXTG-site transpeptidase (sortase) family protein